MEVYKNSKFYGPYKSKNDGRLRCFLILEDGTRKFISYPKYLMEVHLGRYLEENETVHHIDGNPLNNDLNNLQVIDRKEHVTNDVLRNKDITVTCQYCGKEFTIPGSKIHERNRGGGNRKQSGYFCSRECSGKYGKEIQMGTRKPETVDKIIPEKYKKGKSA